MEPILPYFYVAPPAPQAQLVDEAKLDRRCGQAGAADRDVRRAP
jgi:hypothetical protein